MRPPRAALLLAARTEARASAALHQAPAARVQGYAATRVAPRTPGLTVFALDRYRALTVEDYAHDRPLCTVYIQFVH